MCVMSDKCSVAAPGETTSREVFKGCQLPVTRGTLGIATVGDALHKLIPATTAAPCSVKEVGCPASLLPAHYWMLQPHFCSITTCLKNTLPALTCQDSRLMLIPW